MRIRAIVQSRMKSERLPGKVLARIGDLTILEHIAARLKTLASLGVETVFALADEGDPTLADFLREKGLAFMVGDAQNVLKRYTDAADDLEPTDYVIRATGDNPFIDKDRLAALIHHAKTMAFDYGYTAELPLGQGTEMISVAALRSVMMRAVPLRPGEESPLKPHHTEHVTTFIRENPHLYDIYPLRLDDTMSPDGAAERVRGIRVTIDEPADLDVARKIFEHFNRLGNPWFGALDVIALAKNSPEMFAANSAVQQKPPTSFQKKP